MKDIKYYENLIRMMRKDEEMFGLVREDREKINGWIAEINKLKKEAKEDD